MALAVRTVNLETEREQFLALLQENLPDLPHSLRFHWLYHQNPAGAAWSWGVYEQETANLVGVTSLFPRMMWINGTVHRCGQVGDFAIKVTHRSLGPALLLQRATFTPVDQAQLMLCYDCPPHERGLSTFRRLKMSANCQMRRYARLLRVSRLIEKRLGSGMVSTAVSIVGNAALNIWLRRWQTTTGLEIAQHEGAFGDEFSVLDEQRKNEGIHNRRAAADLNWRYRDDPLHTYQVLTARRSGELVGFVVLSLTPPNAQLVDLCVVGHTATALPLLDAAAEVARTAGAEILQALIAERPSETALLQAAQFRCREEAVQVVAYCPPRSTARSVSDDRRQWAFHYADIAA
ncbi:MAG: GNAT family N-acetyltransferase [Deltaproteobacteria bacterium]|nr:GNAT family N-acetyltransferase [Deltaproteobacteria bacterium]